ncbi:MAG TPA: hypothetical protein VM778_03595 [Gemmatimonadota bacterium]|nr:hypothetical protein [Gemmatimonadota bacterium]
MRNGGASGRRLVPWVLVAFLAVACSGGGPSGPGPDPGLDSDGDGLGDDVEMALILQYRPVWEWDAAEEIWPISVEEWAGYGGRVMRGAESREYDDVASFASAAAALPDGTMETVADIRAGAAPCAAGAGCDHAPVYVDAVPARFSHRGRGNLVWLHYWLFFHFDRKVLPPATDLSHYGDWEHVCVLVSLDDLGDPDAPPVGVHFHHHGLLDVVDAAEWHADPACAGGTSSPGCRGTRHPAAYVEANGHGMFPGPGETLLGPHFGERSNAADMLDNPVVFLTPHSTNSTSPVDDAIRAFRGRWGQTPGASPFGPLVPTQPCDHDWDATPTLGDWLPGCRT